MSAFQVPLFCVFIDFTQASAQPHSLNWTHTKLYQFRNRCHYFHGVTSLGLIATFTSGRSYLSRFYQG